MTAALQVVNIVGGYGRATVLRQVSLTLEKTQIVVVLGANGAGKTTLLKTIAGTVVPESGSVALGGTVLNRLKPEEIVREGLVLVPEGRQLFSELSVRDNLYLGGYALRQRTSVMSRQLDRVLDLFPDLRSRLRMRCDRLSGGQQQMVAIGRGLMAQPTVLLLDEPSLGLAPRVVRDLLLRLVELKAAGMSILLVEQHATLALSIADYGYVLERGRVGFEGGADELRESPSIRNAYLGGAAGIPRTIASSGAAQEYSGLPDGNGS